MSGLITCSARLSDKNNTVVKFDTNTNFFYKTFTNPSNILDEQKFIEKLKEHDLFKQVDYNNKLIFEEYGIVFIDFVKNKFYWINNHSAFSYFDSLCFSKKEIEKLEKNNFDLKVRKNILKDPSSKENIETFKVFDKPLGFFTPYCFLHQSLKFSSEIKIKDKVFIDKKHIKDLIPYLKFDKKDSGFSDIIVSWEKWENVEGFADNENLCKVFDYLKKEKLISNLTKKLWEKRLNLKEKT